MKRHELLKSKEYWITKIQLELYAVIDSYLKHEKITKTQFAAKIGVTKGYISQVLNGDFDHKISKLVELSLAANKVPIISFQSMKECLEDDDLGLTLDPLKDRPIVNFNIDYKITNDSKEELTETESYY